LCPKILLGDWRNVSDYAIQAIQQKKDDL